MHADTHSVRMSQRSTITSPYAPDFAELRAWLEQVAKALKFVE